MTPPTLAELEARYRLPAGAIEAIVLNPTPRRIAEVLDGVLQEGRPPERPRCTCDWYHGVVEPASAWWCPEHGHAAAVAAGEEVCRDPECPEHRRPTEADVLAALGIVETEEVSRQFLTQPLTAALLYALVRACTAHPELLDPDPDVELAKRVAGLAVPPGRPLLLDPPGPVEECGCYRDPEEWARQELADLDLARDTSHLEEER